MSAKRRNGIDYLVGGQWHSPVARVAAGAELLSAIPGGFVRNIKDVFTDHRAIFVDTHPLVVVSDRLSALAINDTISQIGSAAAVKIRDVGAMATALYSKIA